MLLQIQEALQLAGFSPLEVVLMGAVTTMFVILIKLLRESITAINNNTNVLKRIESKVTKR
jgi:hypothetical protein